MIKYDIILKNQTPIALKLYLYPKEKQSIIYAMVRDMDEQCMVVSRLNNKLRYLTYNINQQKNIEDKIFQLQ